MKPEEQVENCLIREVKRRGGLTYKLDPTYNRGIPDRLVLLPGGLIFLVELKGPRGRLRPDQKVWHARAALRGVHVWVLSSVAEVKTWLDHVLDTQSTGGVE